MRSVNPGTPRNKVLDRNFINNLLRTEPHSQDTPKLKDYKVGQEIVVKGLAGSYGLVIEPYSPVQIGYGDLLAAGGELPNELSNYPLQVFKPELDDFLPPWGIALDYITNTKMGRVLLTGATWLKTTDSLSIDANVDTMDLVYGDLAKISNGRAQLLGPMGGNYTRVFITQNNCKPIFFGTVTGGAALNTVVDVTLMKSSGTDPSGLEPSDITVKCKTWPSPIVKSPATVELKYMHGMYYAMEIC